MKKLKPLQDPSRLLVVDDDDAVRSRLVEAFSLDGYNAVGAPGLKQARRILSSVEISLVLLDVNLTDGTGYDLLRELRSGELRLPERSLVTLPVLMVSGRAGEIDRIRGFELGCDDYVTKPYSFGELRGRVSAVLRRQAHIDSDDVLHLGELVIDPVSRRVELAGREVQLTHKEYTLLLALAADPMRVIERSELFAAVWGFSEQGSTRTLDAHACRLRSKLDGGQRDYVLNSWGVGYRLFGAPAPSAA